MTRRVRQPQAQQEQALKRGEACRTWTTPSAAVAVWARMVPASDQARLPTLQHARGRSERGQRERRPGETRQRLQPQVVLVAGLQEKEPTLQRMVMLAARGTVLQVAWKEQMGKTDLASRRGEVMRTRTRAPKGEAPRAGARQLGWRRVVGPLPQAMLRQAEDSVEVARICLSTVSRKAQRV